jgi:hypothetical protein
MRLLKDVPADQLAELAGRLRRARDRARDAERTSARTGPADPHLKALRHDLGALARDVAGEQFLRGIRDEH